MFADTYDYVLWVDSDTVAFSDIGKLVSDFARTSCQFALVEDLVTSKVNFQQRWQAATGSANPKPFVPQTALMLFRKSAFARVFPAWESTWRKWIEPAPFAHYGDPDPAFQGSAFCIEQYALGLALEQLSMVRHPRTRTRRKTSPIPTHTCTSSPTLFYTASPAVRLSSRTSATTATAPPTAPSMCRSHL